MLAAPKLSWAIVAYYLVTFLVGAWLEVDLSDGPSSLLDLGRAGLWLIFLTNYFFFAAPWIHESWIAPMIVIVLPVAIVFACFRLKGWIRLIAVYALLLCLNAYSFYVLSLTGG